MPTDTVKWIKINWKVLDIINDNRSIIGSTEAYNCTFWCTQLRLDARRERGPDN
jgi:hypothetical protein